MSEASGFMQLHQTDTQALRAELAAGLHAEDAAIAPKFFYDALGSKLFEAICELPEYYLTRTEAAIFAAHGREMADVAGSGATLIDLGAGNCAKAAALFPLLAPRQYVPVDISVEFLRDALARLAQRFPAIAMLGLGLDFSAALALPAEVGREKRLFFYPGSSIGNFAPQQAQAFLGRLRAAAGDDGAILIGADLLKDRSLLHAAYDDALGVTAAFNRNVLAHANRLLGGDFRLADWRHVSSFDEEAGCITMQLSARRATTVHWPGGARRFEEGEAIHTESSYKYEAGAFAAMLEEAGFAMTRAWTDAQGWFMVCHARAA